MIIQDRDAGRRFFYEVWRKYNAKDRLEPLEELVLGVILEHPEYHEYLENEEDALALEFTPDAGATNPFLHMGMHIAIKEQVQTDRPAGIGDLYQLLLDKRFSDTHALEHRMMECLGETLWRAQRDQTLPDEQAYLECVRKIQ